MAQTTSAAKVAPNLFASLLAAPVIWSVYHFIGYLVVEAACHFGQLNRPGLLGLTPISLIVAGLTLAALLLTAGYGLRSWRKWQAEKRLASGGSAAGSDPGQRTRFLALVGALQGFIFSLVILADGISALVLYPCATW